MPTAKRKTEFVRRKGRWIEIDAAVARYNRRMRRARKQARKRSRMPAIEK